MNDESIRSDGQGSQTAQIDSSGAPVVGLASVRDDADRPAPFDRTKAVQAVHELPVDNDTLRQLAQNSLVRDGIRELAAAANGVLKLLGDTESDAFMEIAGQDLLLSKLPELPLLIEDYRNRNVRINDSYFAYGSSHSTMMPSDPLRGYAARDRLRFPTNAEAALMIEHHALPDRWADAPVNGVTIQEAQQPQQYRLRDCRVQSYNTTSEGLVADVRVADLPQDISRLEFLLEHHWVPAGFHDSERLADLAQMKRDGLVVLKETGGTAEVSPTEKLWAKIRSAEPVRIGSTEVNSGTVKTRMARPDAALVSAEDLNAEQAALLSRDLIRADITQYNPMQLQDPNQGSWELWEELHSGDRTMVPLPRAIYARDPRLDVTEDDVIGIDFGTSSTVVVYLDNEGVIRPMRIGRGEFSHKVNQSDYENPTVMQFRDVTRFMQIYETGTGRPATSWNDLTISQTAYHAWKEAESSENYSSFFNELKQWAGSPDRQVRIRDLKGVQQNLPPYGALGDGDVDPIELYAYYIGLYVNNLHTGRIHLEYLMSFPVTYPQNVRRRILDSFARGIKRSLPQSVLSDPDIMAGFRVEQGAAEPAAYAVCALQEYGLTPQYEEYIPYGVFDFGGGTTDFDFGIWRRAKKDKESKERRYNRVIEHFGGGGDPRLGGENLLELIAYETFKDNRDILLEQRIPFAMPPLGRPFAGSEILVQNSQEAHSNLRRLAEELRPLWEVSGDMNSARLKYAQDNPVSADQESVTENDSSGSADLATSYYAEPVYFEAVPEESVRKLQLFRQDGTSADGIQLQIDAEKLRHIIREKIEEGVGKFFDALLNMFTSAALRDAAGDHLSDRIHIFLAGNASKSAVLKEVFLEKMNEYSMKYNRLLEEKGGHADDESRFKLYYPLGTPESDEQMREAGCELGGDELDRPTGKTGVAFGLLQSRDGSKIKTVSEMIRDEEIPFRYWVGDDDDGQFVVMLSSEDGYGQWVAFVDAGEARFEIRYTSNPSAGQSLPVSATKRARLQIPRDAVDDGRVICIRAIAPNELEYVVAESEDAANQEDYISQPERFVISEG